MQNYQTDAGKKPKHVQKLSDTERKPDKHVKNCLTDTGRKPDKHVTNCQTNTEKSQTRVKLSGRNPESTCKLSGRRKKKVKQTRISCQRKKEI